MASSSAKTIFSSSFWGILAKILDALAKFVTIPMLVGFYGKADYGLIALAFSLNAYLRLMDLGMNVGSVRFFSMWVSLNEWEKIAKVSRSSIVFYGTIGLINAMIFAVMANYGTQLFNLTASQLPIYRSMMYILAFSTVLNWVSNVFVQLLSAKEEIAYINQISIISSILNFLSAFIAIKFQWTLEGYFICYTLSTLSPIPFYIYKLRVFNMNLSKLIKPKWDGKAFKEILGYSIGIFIMGLFQLTANNLRPLLLGKFASGIDVLTDYRVIQTIAMLIVAFGGVFMQVLLPSASKVYAENNIKKMEMMVYDGTKYITILLSFMVFVLIVNANTLLSLYMGESYGALTVWLSLWLITVLISMHNTPVSSLVLSTGKIKPLIYSSAISCVLSIPITILLAKKLNVGAAVIGYLAYIILQIAFYYIYYIPIILKLSGRRLFLRSFLPSFLAGIVACIPVYFLDHWMTAMHGYIQIIINSIVFCLFFFLIHLIFIIKPAELLALKNKVFAK
ncbi:polysaccharide biosynthesis C-terminal domain-containing protein [Olivibacter sp. SDN3]|uniref:oligosaccharide flippase family protein n=1 Tax=Olivibacter sp. SDN3 TaxID=2764720 RepID=UPI00165148D3|nr:oligosaccharide flippase family protein [Olivibacter sp. SDN3]QNL52091.1 polysaccharide biosynthesis C-terminal domain-containing protein [Olivibacter sp. SDN3]